MSINSDGFIIAGNFNVVDSIDAARLARWREGQGWEVVPVGTYGTSASNFNHLIYALHQEGDWLYYGGLFGGVAGSTPTNGIAAYNLNTGQSKTWGTGLGGSSFRVNDILSFKGDIYIAGRFTGVDGSPATNLARLNSNTDTWEAIGDPSNEVRQLTNVRDSILLVVGSFTNIAGNTDLKRVATYDGTDWSAVGKGVQNGNVFDAVYLKKQEAIVVAGSFTQVVGEDGSIATIRRLARFQNGTWQGFGDLTASNDFREAQRLYFDESTGLLYLAGQFSEFGNRPINQVVRIDPNTLAFGDLGEGLDRLNADASGSFGIKVNFMGRQNGKLLLGGKFSSAGINQASGIARYALEDYAGELADLFLDLPDSLAACEQANISTNATAVDYAWSTGATDASIQVSQSGTYALTITSDGGCQNSDSTVVTIFPNPEIAFAGITSDSVATCDSILLALEKDYVEYSWNDGSSFDPTLTVYESGTVRVTVQDENNCIGSDTLAVLVSASPVVDFTFEVVEDSVFFFVIDPLADLEYLWDFGDGAMGMGATPFHVYTANGTYPIKVRAVSASCGEALAESEVLIDQTNALATPFPLSNFMAQPNPFTDQVVLQWETIGQAENFSLDIVDWEGKVRWSQNYPGQQRHLLTLDLQHLAAGIYIGHLRGAKGVYSFKLVKQ